MIRRDLWKKNRIFLLILTGAVICTYKIYFYDQNPIQQICHYKFGVSLVPTCKPIKEPDIPLIHKSKPIKELNISLVHNSKPIKTPNISLVHTIKPKVFICTKPTGRLGNLMFVYASTFGIARSKNMDVVVSKNDALLRIFNIQKGAKILSDWSPCKKTKVHKEIRPCAFDKGTINFSNKTNITLKGYLQSYKYFQDYSADLREQFIFKKHIQDKANNVLKTILQKHIKAHRNESTKWVSVAIHVRRGDRINNTYGYMVADQDYFLRAQNMFRTWYKHVIFVVCSNDMTWSKKNLQSNNTYFITGNSPEVDMTILSSCEHIISSVGSFSWWASWLNKGKKIYFFPPSKEHSLLRKDFSSDYKDHFLSEWIRV